MKSNEEPDSGQDRDVEPIPEELQNISTEELVETDYKAVPPTSTEDGGDGGRKHHDVPVVDPPGRTRYDDSINASSNDPGGSPHKDAYSAGYDSPMATRIGDEGDGDSNADRLRELHDGRHHSDGNLSTRQSQCDKTRIAEAICSALPLAQHERKKVLSVVESLDFSKFGQQKAIERVALGVVTVVVDERHRQRDDVDGDIVTFTDKYREMCNSLNVSMSDLGTIKETIRESLDEGDTTVWRREPLRDPLLPEPTPMDEYPREYWDNFNPENWVRLARTWSSLPDGFKEAIPEEYRDIIENLRQWEPWVDKEGSVDSNRDVELVPEEPTDTDEMDGVPGEMSDKSTE